MMHRKIVALIFWFSALVLACPSASYCQTPWQNYGHLHSSPAFKPWLIVKCQFADIRNIPAGEDQTIAQLFTPGLFPTGNMLDYFSDVSYGAISLEGSKVIPNWVTSTYTSLNSPSTVQTVQTCANQVSGIGNLLTAYSIYGIAVFQNAGASNLGSCYYGQGP